MKRSKISSEDGLTLVEMTVVALVVMIVATLAFMSQGRSNAQFQRQNAARELKTAFELARFDSVKRRADSTASPSVPHAYVRIDSAVQFTLVTDNNNDGDLTDAGDSVATRFAPNVNLAPRSGVTLPVTVSFNRRGEPDLTDASFVVCNGVCDFSNDTSAIADIVHVTPTGTVNLLAGGSTIPSFPAPSVTAIGANTSIRSQTYIAP